MTKFTVDLTKNVQAEFEFLEDEGFTGTIGDRRFGWLRSKGYTGALADMQKEHTDAGYPVSSIEAVVTPATSVLTVGEALEDTTNWATFLNTSNYTSGAGTISSVVVNYTGDGANATDAFTDGESNVFTITVTDSAANERVFTTTARTVIYAAAPTFSVQPSFTSDPVIGDTITFSEGTAGPGATLSITTLTLDDVDKSGELSVLDWDTTGESAGVIAFQVTATNSAGSTLSNLVTDDLFDGANFGVENTSEDFSVVGVGNNPSDNISITIAAGPYAGTYTTRHDGSTLTNAMVDANPTCLVKPVVTGSTGDGDTLTITPGLWLYAGDDPGSQTWQQQFDGVDISGATDLDYTITLIDDSAKVFTIEETFDGITVESAGVTIDTFVPGDYTATDLVADLFGSGEEGHFIQTVDNTDLYSGASPTGSNVTDGNTVGSMVDSSGNGNTVVQATTGARGIWRATDKGIELDGTDDGFSGSVGTPTTTMTAMFAISDVSDAATGNGAKIYLSADDTTSGWFAIDPDGGGNTAFSNVGSPTIYVDGVEFLANTSQGLWDLIDDGGIHLIEIRNIDMTIIGEWATDGAQWGKRSVVSNPTEAIFHSPLVTSNNTPADIEAARQYYVDQHGVTLS